MKIFNIKIVVIFLLLSQGVKAQTVKDYLDDISKIYLKTLLWVADIWKNPKEVIQMQDERAGIVVIVGQINSTSLRMAIKINDQLAKVEFSDESYQFVNTTFKMEETKQTSSLRGKGREPYEAWKKLVPMIENELFESYKSYLLK
ncbi:MAG: hypothetical protein NVSMB66_7630 [Candidatus Doudnabacteria bacterium]